MWIVNKNDVLNCDASKHGIIYVKSHIVVGNEKPIDYASSTMNKIEINHAMLDKEDAYIIFGVAKFYQYFARKRFDSINL